MRAKRHGEFQNAYCDEMRRKYEFPYGNRTYSYDLGKKKDRQLYMDMINRLPALKVRDHL